LPSAVSCGTEEIKAVGFDAFLSSSARNDGKAALLQGQFLDEEEV